MRGATPDPLSIDSLLVLKDWKELVQYLQRKSRLRYRQTGRQTDRQTDLYRCECWKQDMF